MVGQVAWLIRALVDLIAAHVMAGRVIHADDTPVPVLAPGAGKTTKHSAINAGTPAQGQSHLGSVSV
jgi:hypothetical protein